MTVPATSGTKHAGGRRAGKRPTRGTILAAARRLFASEGAEGTTIRAVAQAAGVDAALVIHYFGSKENLFQAAIEWPVDMGAVAERVLAGDIDGLGERIVSSFLQLWEDPVTRHPFEIILRRATQRQSHARLLTEFFHDQIISRLAVVLPPPDAERRGNLIQSTLIGLAMARYIMRVAPLADDKPEDIVAMVAPTIQRYLNGSLTPDRG
jgi:AcrR family transcriptional regulator